MTTAPTTINDRVPAIKLYENATQSDQTTSAKISVDSTPADENVTATYTISAPATIVNKTDASVVGEKISATYTIPTPLSSLLTSPTKKLIPSHNKPTLTSNSSSGEFANQENIIETPTISATISVPLCNNKTDFDKAETRVPSPTSSKTNSKFDAKYNDILPTSVPVVAAKHDSAIDSHRDKQTPIEFTFSKPMRDKRSLFDLDNASSLSLADKLRNESDKYLETSRSNNDVSSMGQQQTVSTGSAISDANEIERKYGSTPSSPMHHITAERRPSWRLKIDAGSKVRKRYSKKIKANNVYC